MTTSLEDLNQRLLDDLGKALNRAHNVSFSLKFWERFLGYWFANFVDLAKVEWASAREAIPEAQITKSEESAARPIRRMSQLLEFSQSEGWRSLLRSDATEFVKTGQVLPRKHVDRSIIQNSNPLERASLVKKFARNVVHRIVPRSSRFILVTTYLSLWSNIALAFRLRSAPTYWVEPTVPVRQLSLDLRTSICEMLSGHEDDSFDIFIRSVISDYLPMSVVEEFEVVAQAVDQMRPRSPKVIFSANLHFASDTFACWLAKQCDMGAVLLLSQHGGLNGQGFHPTNDENLEKRIADWYCHWGWSTRPTDVRIPAQSIVWVRSRRRVKSDGPIVLMSDATFRFKRNTWTDSHRYKHLVIETFGAIPNKFRSRAIVRLHRDHDRYDESHIGMWNGSFPEAIIDDGWRSVKKLQKSAKLLICTTYGTTEIECFGRNIPVVLSLDRELHQPRESFADLLCEMESVGLVHFNRESLRAFLDENLDDLGKWWNSAVVQQTVSKYMNNYGYMPRRPISELARILREAERSSRKRSLPQSNQ
jgi:putative transferase (TIGR04331 family)